MNNHLFEQRGDPTANMIRNVNLIEEDENVNSLPMSTSQMRDHLFPKINWVLPVLHSFISINHSPRSPRLTTYWSWDLS